MRPSLAPRPTKSKPFARDKHWAGDCASQEFDLAVLHLADPVSNVEPVAMGAGPPTVGDACTGVGFGLHTGNDGSTAEKTLGQRRSGSETVSSIQLGRIRTLAQSITIDHGDSGGPLICGGQLVGVASCGNADEGYAIYSRVDHSLNRIFEAGEVLRNNVRRP